MDRKSFAAIALCLGLIFLWQGVIVPKYLTPERPPVTTQPSPAATDGAVEPSTTAPATQPAVSSAATVPTIGPDTAPQLTIAASADEEFIVITNTNARYTFTSFGGGLKSVELFQYPETVSRRNKKNPLTNGLATLNDHAKVPVFAILGGDAVQGDGVFALSETREGVRAEKLLTNGLRIIKEFRLGTNYLVSTKVTLENTTRGALTLPAQEWVIGTATPMSADDDGMAVGLMWYDGKKEKDITQGWFENKTLGCFPGVPRSVYREGLSNVVWASVHNQYFTMVTMPKVPAEQIVSRPVELPADLKHNPQQKGFQTALLVPAMTLAANQSVVNEFEVFAGPKEYRTLARIAARFQNNVDLIMGFGGFFGFFSKGLLLGMNWLHSVFHLSYAWSIIAITVIIKILFWPLTAASTRSMKRMAALQPQMKALQEKYKEDPAKLNKKMMEMWKEHKVSPIGGCLPIIIQMPVFIGFFYMIRSAIELRGASWFWVADLSRPDTLFYIPGFDFPFNLLPLIMGATMLWQSHLTPPSPGMDPVQQKMMRYMPLIFLVFLYNFSSGLALYWTVNNLLTILQTKLTKTKDPIIAAPAAASPLTHAPKKKK